MSEEKQAPAQQELAAATNADPGVPEMSPEEIKIARGSRLNWYKEQIPFLKAEADYREAQARIEEHKFKILDYQYKQMQIYAAMNPPQDEPTPTQETVTETTTNVAAE